MSNANSQSERHSLFRLSLNSEIEIETDAETVWEMLTDFAGYQGWNPAIISAAGEATKGCLLQVVIHWPGLKPGRYELEVLNAERPNELRWLGHFLMPGLMDGDHRFIIKQAGEGLVKVTQKEDFSGLIVPIFAPWLNNNVLEGFKLINDELKRRIEQS